MGTSWFPMKKEVQKHHLMLKARDQAGDGNILVPHEKRSSVSERSGIYVDSGTNKNLLL
jgi:hypothetical protein